VCHGQASAAVAAKAKAAPAKAPAVEKYAVLNPRADLPPIDAKALAPRLASLEGKTVYVNGSDANMNAGLEIMLLIARGLAKAVPGIKVVYLSDRYGDAKVDSVVPSIQIVRNPTDAHSRDIFKDAQGKADAVVTGLGY
jgi:hypothetical protein